MAKELLPYGLRNPYASRTFKYDAKRPETPCMTTIAVSFHSSLFLLLVELVTSRSSSSIDVSSSENDRVDAHGPRLGAQAVAVAEMIRIKVWIAPVRWVRER